MNNEQLTQEVMKLKEQQGKSLAEHEKFELILKELQEDVKATKTLAEDVHIMAINMQNMKEAQEETNKKVDSLMSKDFLEYKENKKIIKDKFLSTLISSVTGFIIGVFCWVILNYLKGGM